MAANYRQVLGILADLEHAGAGTELDEFSLAVALDLVPGTMPPFTYTMSPARGELLRVLTALEASKCIYATKNGFWRLRLTAAGRRLLAAPEEPETAMDQADSPDRTPPFVHTERTAAPVVTAANWEAPRTAQVRVEPRKDWFTGIALVVTLGAAVLIFVVSSFVQGPLAQRAAAQPDAPLVAASPPSSLPVASIMTPAATPSPSGSPATGGGVPPAATKRYYVVTNTGGSGVYLRRTPQLDDRLTAWPDATRLEELGPSVSAGGLTWRHVRTPDGTEGYVPAQYTAEAN